MKTETLVFLIAIVVAAIAGAKLADFMSARGLHPLCGYCQDPWHGR